MHCGQCEMLAINGVACHETGCPEAWRGQIRQCKECGLAFRATARPILQLNGVAVAIDEYAKTRQEFPKVEGEFPRFEQVLPDANSTDTVLCFNPEYLYRLAQAIGAVNKGHEGWIRVRVPKRYDRTAPLRVESEHGYGAIMPITIDT